MKNMFLFLVLWLPIGLTAQQLAVVATGGQDLKGGGAVISFTIGEVCVDAAMGADRQATAGFQQGFGPEQEAPGKVADRDQLEPFRASVFPNPTMDWVQIDLQNTGNQPVRLRLFTSQGTLVQEVGTTALSHRFDVTGLSAGRYWIALQSGQNRPDLTLSFEKISR